MLVCAQFQVLPHASMSADWCNTVASKWSLSPVIVGSFSPDRPSTPSLSMPAIYGAPPPALGSLMPGTQLLAGWNPGDGEVLNGSGLSKPNVLMFPDAFAHGLSTPRHRHD